MAVVEKSISGFKMVGHSWNLRHGPLAIYLPEDIDPVKRRRESLKAKLKVFFHGPLIPREQWVELRGVKKEVDFLEGNMSSPGRQMILPEPKSLKSDSD